MILIRQKHFTNSEGKHTREVRRKNDIKDIASSASLGALYGGIAGAPVGASIPLAAIGGAGNGAIAALKSVGRKRNTKKGKTPHQPDELRRPEIGKKTAAALSIGAGIAGGLSMMGSKDSHAARLANNILKGKFKGTDEGARKQFENYVMANKLVYGRRADSKIIDEIKNTDIGKKYIKKERTKRAIVGGLLSSGVIAASLLHEHKKRKKLEEAYKKDLEEFKKENKDKGENRL